LLKRRPEGLASIFLHSFSLEKTNKSKNRFWFSALLYPSAKALKKFAAFTEAKGLQRY